MFYFLSKTLGMLSQPVYLMVIFLIVTILTKNAARKRKMLVGTLVLLYLSSNNFLTNAVMKWWEIPPTPLNTIQQTYEVGIVLGGAMHGHMAPRDRIYTNKGADRVLHAAMLYHKGIIKNILVSGSYTLLTGTQPYTEADDMAQLLQMCGVPDSAIIKEGKSANTWENALFCREILQEKFPDQKFLLITSAFHMRRSIGCFEKVGLAVDPFSTDFYTSDPVYHWGIPIDLSADALMVSSKLGKEWLGYLSYWAVGYL